ncbi:alpha-L-fucosidase [Micromonospora sp. NPDC048930]|uniref:alpha-L-fucosidase n=1 Tax=Micromonospora sp. NPDC048930 TaxID=3364261 RepID=UPI00371CA5BA
MSPSPSHLSRRSLLAAVGLTGAATAAGLSNVRLALATVGPSSYTASWSSVDQHPPAAEWFQDAKFGIYYHWGVYSVPAYASEWYPRNMYNAGSNENNYHRSVYGDPSVWPYHNFINGAPDRAGNWVQFAPKLRSAGGTFDPNEWAQLFADAGARFAGPVAEHHDGFSMWNSSVNEWNSVARGPRLDLLRLQADAIRAKGLKLWVSLHHAYNFTGYFQWAPSQSDTSLRKLYGQLGATAEYQLWYDKLREIIDGYQPDIIFQDFNLSRIPESYRLNFLSYYYNRAVAWSKDVVATYKDGFNNRGEVYDFERGGPAGIQTPYSLTDDSVSSSSWCYTQGIGYYSTRSLMHALPRHADLGAAPRLRRWHVPRPAQPHPGRLRPVPDHALVQCPVQRPRVRRQAHLRGSDPPVRQRPHAHRVREDCEFDDGSGAGQWRECRVGVGGQAVE